MYHCLIFNVEKENHARNLGAYRIAHWLRNQNWDAEVIDYALLWSFDELVQLAKIRINKNTKFIGFSFQFGVWDETLERFAFWLNTFYPDIKLISGSSIWPAKNTPIDYHIYGFGEYALDHLLKYLFSNGAKPQMVEYGNIRLIDAAKYPAYPLSDYSVYYEERDFIQPWEFLCIETGRGCIFKCSFCNFSILGVKTDHSTSSESFERQLKENYSRWGVKNYLISEETFNDRPDKIKKFAKVVNELDFTPWFSAFIRLDLLLSRVDDKKLLEDMNVLGHYYGIESFNSQTAKAFKKGMAPEKIKSGLLDIKKFYSDGGKYRGTASFILGGPHETKETLDETLKWSIDNWSDQAIAFFVLGIPIGENRRPSELTDNYEKHGYRETTLSKLKNKYPNEKGIFQRISNKRKYSDDRSLLWENDHMDIIECHKIYDNWKKARSEHGFKLTGFMMGKFMGKNTTINDKLKFNWNQLNEYTLEEQKWHREYINKKLNWIR